MEFKKLSDVEVVAEPTESANVLIEENGVIKKTPKTAVGGSGGGLGEHWVSLSEPDYSVTASKGIYEAVKNYIYNGGVPIIINTYMVSTDEYGRMYEYSHSLAETISWSNDDDGDIGDLQIVGCRGVVFFIKKDGSCSYYWD